MHSENTIKYHVQKFYVKIAFWGQHLTGLSIEKFKNSVFVVLKKKSAKKPTIYDSLFLIAIYSPINDDRHPSEMSN